MTSLRTFLAGLFFTLIVSQVGGQNDTAPTITEGSKKLPLPGESFQINGRDAFVIAPKETKGPVPWVWYAPTLPGLPAKSEVWMFRRFLEKGIAIAGIDVGESYGSPEGRKAFGQLYEHLTKTRGFGSKPCLLARSRGGLMLYNWAVENPEKVGGIAGIYPVCNLESYPGLKKAAPAYQLTTEDLRKRLPLHNPIERLAPLAKAGVPILHLHGDNDRIVPHRDNSAILARNYQALGGPISLEVFAGQGHNMWTGWFQSESLTVFVIRSALAH